MAFNVMLRRATKSLLPLATRTVASPKTFQRTITTLIGVQKQSLGVRNFLPAASRFCSETARNQSADDSLLSVLDSEIECAEEPQEVDDIPIGFPFEILDNDGEKTITLTRKYNGEVITVEVDMPSEVEENDDEDDEKSESSGIPLVVSIAKQNGSRLEFGITAFDSEITIDHLTFKSQESVDDQLAYEGPDFSDLDENLQGAFYKYLEVRGIKPSMTSFLVNYMENKENKEYLLWLTNLKSFVEK